MIFSWLEAHDRQSKKDTEELKRFFFENSEEHTRNLQIMIQKQDITSSGVGELQENVHKIYEIIKVICL